MMMMAMVIDGDGHIVMITIAAAKPINEDMQKITLTTPPHAMIMFINTHLAVPPVA